MALDIPSWGLGFDVPYPSFSGGASCFLSQLFLRALAWSTFPQSLSCLLCQTPPPEAKSFPFEIPEFASHKEGQKSFPDRVLA